MSFLSTPSARRATAKTFSGLFEQQFLSTPSARRATFDKKYESEQPKISIHALREEGDLRRPCSHAGKAHFYPRPPRGGRLIHKSINIKIIQFLSTPSARRATS